MAFENNSDFEFTAKGSEIKNVPRSQTDIKRLYFYTDDLITQEIDIGEVEHPPRQEVEA